MLYFATGNPEKVKEAQAILGIPIKIAELELDEIQDIDIEKVASRKVQEAFNILKKPVFIDDVGVYIEAWNGFPGPFAKFLQEAGGCAQILRMLENEKNRNVLIKSLVAFCDGKKIHIFTGELHGKIAFDARGKTGWGFDPIIIPDGQGQTYAEMGEEKKNSLSHRRLALDKFKKFLNKQTS